MKEKIISNFVPFPQCPYTDAPYVLWFFAQRYLQVQHHVPEYYLYKCELERDYISGLFQLQQACLRAEAVSTDDILFQEAGTIAQHILATSSFKDFRGRRQRYTRRFWRATERLLAITEYLQIPIQLQDIRSHQWLIVANFAHAAGLQGSAFLRYVQRFGEEAIQRLVIHNAGDLYSTVMRERDTNARVRW
ncbi:MAG: hypothetical protein WCV85_01445 [Patescibacteria group bacterium]|jgi:hypothetical protein